MTVSDDVLVGLQKAGFAGKLAGPFQGARVKAGSALLLLLPPLLHLPTRGVSRIWIGKLHRALQILVGILPPLNDHCGWRARGQALQLTCMPKTVKRAQQDQSSDQLVQVPALLFSSSAHFVVAHTSCMTRQPRTSSPVRAKQGLIARSTDLQCHAPCSCSRATPRPAETVCPCGGAPGCHHRLTRPPALALHISTGICQAAWTYHEDSSLVQACRSGL